MKYQVCFGVIAAAKQPSGRKPVAWTSSSYRLDRKHRARASGAMDFREITPFSSCSTKTSALPGEMRRMVSLLLFIQAASCSICSGIPVLSASFSLVQRASSVSRTSANTSGSFECP